MCRSLPSHFIQPANGHGAGVHDATLIDEFGGKSFVSWFAPDTVIDLGLDGGKVGGISNPRTLKPKITPLILEMATRPLQLIERMHILPLAIRRLSRSSRKDGPSDY